MSRPLRVWVVGLGTVGRWLLESVHEQAASISSRTGVAPLIVGVANARDGFVYAEGGLDIPRVLELAESGRAISDLPGTHHWPTSREGLQATESDLLVEVTQSPRETGEPGFSHMREALGRGIPVVTSNKWPVALHGVELAGLARVAGVPFRAESTVMSGTPVLSTLVDGLAGTTPVRLRGVLNATANFILTEMEQGLSYEEALQRAQDEGLAERDPSADVDGYDSLAKTLILAALVFGVQLRIEHVFLRGIGHLGRAEIDAARSEARVVRLVSTIENAMGEKAPGATARVEPIGLPADDPLARIAGVTNAVVYNAEPVGEVMVSGPGAGLALAGQGVFSDLIAVACWRGGADRRRAANIVAP